MGCSVQPVVLWEAWTLATGTPGGGTAQQQASTCTNFGVAVAEVDLGGLWWLLV